MLVKAVRKGELTRQAVLEHAARVASRLGIEGLTIGALAEELGLSKSGLFGHFKSKEALQLQTVEFGIERFIDTVVKPALATPRGEKRVRAVFERWLAWPKDSGLSGCMFVALSAELDDQPGPIRERLVQSQKDWLDVIANCVRTGITEGDFRKDVDSDQFSHELYGIMLASHHAARLLQDKTAVERTRRAFERLLDDARA
ncbi:MAG TPA: TetR/AcrR family transcriptional regulator [Vicinamibacteria bacterium]|nr:TetR/AcrR family transcriptional regulator [Vicinamibacteria bacterium]